MDNPETIQNGQSRDNPEWTIQRQSRDNPEIMTTFGTQDTRRRQNKENRVMHVFEC